MHLGEKFSKFAGRILAVSYVTSVLAFASIGVMIYIPVMMDEVSITAGFNKAIGEPGHIIFLYKYPDLPEKEPELTIEPLSLPITTATWDAISEEVDWYLVKPAPGKSKFKPYMDADTITSRGSDQYKLKLHYELDTTTGIWTVDGRYCVALGSYYTTEIGTYVDVVLKNGTVLPCILADCKADRHTDSTNRQNPNGSVVEFIVNTSSLPRKVRKRGDCSYEHKSWKGDVKEVIVYE